MDKHAEFLGRVAVPKCGDCAFYSPDDERGFESGECRIGPPSGAVLLVDDEPSVTGVFPPTSAFEWCGEFRTDRRPNR